MSRGRIEKALSGFYYVNTGAETLQCRARGKFRREGMSPLVGDWVQVRDLGGLGIGSSQGAHIGKNPPPISISWSSWPPPPSL